MKDFGPPQGAHASLGPPLDPSMKVKRKVTFKDVLYIIGRSGEVSPVCKYWILDTFRMKQMKMYICTLKNLFKWRSRYIVVQS